MTFLGDFHFIRPAWLLLGPVVVWAWWLVRRSQDPLRGWRAVMDRELLTAMTVGRIDNPPYFWRGSRVGRIDNPSGRNGIPSYFWRGSRVGRIANPSGRNGIPSYFWRGSSLLAGWLLGVVALAGPTWWPEPAPFADDPVPVMLVLKAGATMDLTDLAPSRMERARLKIADFAAQRKGLPLGLVAYAGSAHLVLPPTRDTSVVAAMAAEISPAIMPKPGDELVGSLILAARTLGDAGGSIVVVADAVLSGSESALREFRSTNRLPVHFLATSRAYTPELEAINNAASALGAGVTLMTSDSSDIGSLVRRTAKVPVAVAGAGEGSRWAEAGWWLLPVLAWLSLRTFRRERNANSYDDRLTVGWIANPTIQGRIGNPSHDQTCRPTASRPEEPTR